MPSIPQLETLLRAEPNDPFLLYGLAQEHAKAGDTAHAIEFYDRCIAADPAYCYAYYHKAVALKAATRIPEALAAIEAGLAASKAAKDSHAMSELQALRDDLQ